MSDRISSLRALVSVFDNAALEEKRKELHNSIHNASLMAAAGALIPIASMFIDLKILHDQTDHYRTTLGLDRENLEKCASLFRKDPNTLFTDFGLKSMVISFTAEGLKRLTLKTCTTEIAKLGSFIPFFGQAVAATATYNGTYYFLEQLLEETYQDALILREILLTELEKLEEETRR